METKDDTLDYEQLAEDHGRAYVEADPNPSWSVGGLVIMLGAGIGYIFKCSGDAIKKPGAVGAHKDSILSGCSDQQRLASRLKPWLD